MRLPHSSRVLSLEDLENRRLLAADVASACPEEIPALLGNLGSSLANQHLEQDHAGHGHDHNCGCEYCRGHDHSDGFGSSERLASSGASGDWNPGPAQPITEVVRVQPIVVSNDDGSQTAGFFGNSTQEASIKDLIDQIWAQAGIDIEWLAPNFWNNSFANFGTSSPRPNNDLDVVTDSGDSAGIGNSDPLILDLYFVEVSAGFSQLTNSHANGLAYVGGNGSTIHIGDSLPTFQAGREVAARVVAHEIGHNLGLGHTGNNENLMINGETLTSAQSATAIASSFSQPAPFELSPGESITSPNGQFQLILQTDGNLVLYNLNEGVATWHTYTSGQAVTNAVFQTDGNFVLYNGSQALWHSHTYGNADATLELRDDGVLSISLGGQDLWSSNEVTRLLPGQSMLSANAEFLISMQTDGNLVVYERATFRPVWHTHTFGQPVAQAVMQTDGNFVLYDSVGTPIWHAHSYGNSGARLILQDSGELNVLTNLGNIAWSSSNIEQLSPNETRISANGQFQVSMQGDGNLVVYDRGSGRPIWFTGTTGSSSTSAEIRSDGNFVVLDGGNVIWETGTSGYQRASLRLSNDGTLSVFSNLGHVLWSSRDIQQLAVNTSVISSNEQYQLSLQGDGNLVIYNRNTWQPVWHSSTFGRQVTEARIQPDGNFVIANGSAIIWSTATNGNSGARLTLGDDGVLRVLSTFGVTLWASS